MNIKRILAVLALVVTWLSPFSAAQSSTPPSFVAPRAFSWNSAANPENIFWPTSWWWLNGTLDPAVLRAQLADMKAHELRNVLVYPLFNDFRPNDFEMNPNFLTPEFANRLQTITSEAVQLDMNLWFNGEGAWPVGFALRHNPNYATQYATYQLAYSNDTWTQGRNTSSYVNADLLSAQTTNALINTTYQPYLNTIGQQRFSQVGRFMFTDEPAYQYFSPGSSIPWTPGAGAVFQSKVGYDVLANNKLNAFAVSPSSLNASQKQVRVDVIDFVSGQLRDNYFLPIRDWCRQNGVAQAGHLGGENLTIGATQFGFGSAMRQLRAMDMPGVDAICREIFPGQKIENNFPKFASSVAHQNGTALTFTESFAVYGSGLTPSQMKWVLDYQFVRGINQYLGCLYPITTRDNSMTDIRPQLNKSPLWDYMPAFHRYTARLGYTMACGQPDIDVGLYYPVRDIWANGSASDPAVQGYDRLTQALLERQCDYDVIDDDILNDPATRVENGRLVLGAMSYRTIVVGPTAWMTQIAQQQIAAFQAAGGQVLRINDPGQINAAIAGITPSIQLSTASSDIRVAQRRWTGGGAVFLFNEGKNAYSGTATFELAGKPYQLDPATGVTRAVNCSSLPGGRFSLSLKLAAGESMVLIAQPPQDVPANLAPPAATKVLQSVVLADGWKARVDRKYVVGQHDYEIHESENAQFRSVALGRWASTLGLGEDFSGHVTYRRTVAVPESMRGGRLMLDLGGLEYAARVKVDGQDVGCVLWSPWTIELPSLGNRTEFVLDIEMSNTFANEISSQRVQDAWNAMSGQPGWPSPYNARNWAFEMESRGGGLFGPVQLQLVVPEPGS